MPSLNLRFLGKSGARSPNSGQKLYLLNIPGAFLCKGANYPPDMAKRMDFDSNEPDVVVPRFGFPRFIEQIPKTTLEWGVFRQNEFSPTSC
jgi:hypothetical protein